MRGNSCAYQASYARPPPAGARSALRRGRTAPSRSGSSGLLATQRRAVRSQADTRPDERISRREDSRTATPKMEFPRVQLKHDQPASTPDGRSPNRGWALPFAVPQAAAPGGTLQAAGAHFPAGLTPAGKGVLTFTTDGNAGKGRLWPPRRVLQPWPGGGQIAALPQRALHPGRIILRGSRSCGTPRSIRHSSRFSSCRTRGNRRKGGVRWDFFAWSSQCSS